MKRRRCILHRRHHPRKRKIQYSAPLLFNLDVTAYWMPAFAGMTVVAEARHEQLPRKIAPLDNGIALGAASYSK
jgi:hypothetical protein